MATKTDLIIKTSDALGNLYETKYGYANPDATAEEIDTCARAIVDLSKRTYIDTFRVTTESINETLAE